MTNQPDHATEQARIMPTNKNNKSYGNSRESKNRGYPPFLDGIGIEIPSLYTPPYSDASKFSDKNCHLSNEPQNCYTNNESKNCHYVGGWKFFSVCEREKKFHTQSSVENFTWQDWAKV